MAATLFALLVAFAFGFAVIMFLWPQRLRRADLPLLTFLAAGIGLGLSSCLFFFWIAVFNGRHDHFVRNEVVVVITLNLCALFARQRKRIGGMVQGELSRSGGPGWILTAAFCAALVVAGIAFARLCVAAPHGSFDAWGIWNLHAKFLFVNDQHWRDGFSHDLAWSHPDYPLLVPASVARLWSYSGAESTSGPIFIAIIFTLATVGLLVSALSALRSAGQGLLAGTILLATPFFVVLGAAQYADVPLGFFCLAAVVLVCLHRRIAGNAVFTLAGITAGLAMWTKNEGVPLFVSLLITHLAVNLRRRNRPEYLRELALFVGGALPIVAVLIYFKFEIGTQNIFLSQPGTVLHRLTDLSRYGTILRAGLAEIFNFGAWSVSLTPCIAFYVLITGFRERLQQSTTAVACLTLVFTAMGYFVIYLIAPLPLDWLLASSLNRLLIQLWPSVLFLVFLQARTPEEAISSSGVIAED